VHVVDIVTSLSGYSTCDILNFHNERSNAWTLTHCCLYSMQSTTTTDKPAAESSEWMVLTNYRPTHIVWSWHDWSRTQILFCILQFMYAEDFAHVHYSWMFLGSIWDPDLRLHVTSLWWVNTFLFEGAGGGGGRLENKSCIMLVLCQNLKSADYAQNYAGI